MRIALTGRNLDVTPALRQLVRRRLARVDRFLQEHVISSQVVLSLERHRHLTELTVHARGGHILHGLGDASSWQASVTEAVEKVSQQGHRLKDRWQTRRRRASGAKGRPGPAVLPDARSRNTTRPRVRTARYPVKPMTVDDAALQLESTDDTFLVFRNAETEGVSIVFRRKNGRLGLIEPER